LLYTAVAINLSILVWGDEYAFPRALHEIFLTGALALLAVNRWVTRGLSAGALALWLTWAVNRYGSP
jgi:hypothetical protein